MTSKIVLISGSLRARSTNSAVIDAAAACAPPGFAAVVFSGLAGLPHFNPDEDRDPVHTSVANMRRVLGEASAVMLSVPEYAGAMPGSLKNLIDWTVSAGSFYEKPVGWINPAGKHRAQDTYRGLRIVLDRAGAKLVDRACIDIDVGPDARDDEGRIVSADIRDALAEAMRQLAVGAA